MAPAPRPSTTPRPAAIRRRSNLPRRPPAALPPHASIGLQEELHARLLARRGAAAALRDRLQAARRRSAALLQALPQGAGARSEQETVRVKHSVHRMLGVQFLTDSNDSGDGSGSSVMAAEVVTDEAWRARLPLLVMLVSKEAETGLYRLKATELCRRCGHSEETIEALEVPASRQQVVERFRTVHSDVLDLMDRESLRGFLAAVPDVKPGSICLSLNKRNVQFQIPRVDLLGSTTERKQFLGIELKLDSHTTSVTFSETESLAYDVKPILEKFQKFLVENKDCETIEALQSFFDDWERLKSKYENMRLHDQI